MSAAKARTLSLGSRRPIISSRRAEPSAAFCLADRQAFDLSLGDLFGRQSLSFEDGFERAGDVPAHDRGIVDRRRIAVLEAEANQNVLGCSLFVGLAVVRSDQIEVALGVAGHAFPLRPATVQLGKSRRGDRLAQDPAARQLDDVKRRVLVVRDQEPPAVADRLDPRGLDHDVDFPVLEAAGREGGRRFEPEFIGAGESRGDRSIVPENHGKAKPAGSVASCHLFDRLSWCGRSAWFQSRSNDRDRSGGSPVMTSRR